MRKLTLKQVRYPIGKYIAPNQPSATNVQDWVNTIEVFPKNITSLTSNLNIAQLNWKYRPNGWTIKQVVHHCSDSHMNSFIRFKLAITEDAPTIKPYMEHLWAELPDGTENDISDSILLLKAVHSKWVKLLNTFATEQWARTFIHPEGNTIYRLDEALALYAWHCRHHTAHIEQAIKYKGKF